MKLEAKMRKTTLTKLEIEAIRDLAQAKRPEDLKTYTRHIFVIPASPAEVKKVRARLKQSQSQFADWLGVSVVTVQAWEAGRRVPEAVASKVIRYGAKHPDWVREFSQPELLGVEAIR